MNDNNKVRDNKWGERGGIVSIAMLLLGITTYTVIIPRAAQSKVNVNLAAAKRRHFPTTASSSDTRADGSLAAIAT